MEAAVAELYAIPDEHLEFRETIRRISRERVAPRAADIDEKAEYPHDLRELFAEQDLFGLPFETEYGGTGTGTLMLNLAIEEVAKVCASTALMLMVQELGTLPIRLFGSEELKQRFLPRCATGEWTPAFALSEPEAGSDPGGMITRARREGDEWVITGTKNWITNLGIADFYVVFAVTDGQVGHSHGISAFVVEADRPGFSVGKLEHKLGIRGSPTGQPIFDDVRVPVENLIDEVGHGFKVAMATLDHSRLGVAAQALGIAQGATDYAAAYAKERRQFGKPIAAFQGIQFKLADMETQCAAARELLYKACAKVDRREREALLLRCGDEGHGGGRSGARRLRLCQGVSRRAVSARCQDHADLRGHQRDPAPGDRALDVSPPLRRIVVAAGIALSLGLAFIALVHGFSEAFPLRVLEGVAVFVAGACVIGAPMVWLALRLADWRDPESEEEFERVVVRSERLARDNLAVEPDEGEFLELDPYDDDEFAELVGDALDELPDWARTALERNVAVVISDDGAKRGAYGLYHGDGVAREDAADRIVIYRDTLRRDFGEDPDELHDQVVRTVRHELAHHLGWNELGVRDLGL